ncbi:unnamed protein product [Adineta steineri]|uniref:Uncharacterized protein n=1 Tax=Adineta steineri TaxID=433720 RepID=A0A815I1I8_9BILA|nr:unnamed protein product [Adineta steineri]CAF3760358.1 unnamed protein product [Adineta steineri]
MSFMNTSIEITTESWFIPIDIVMIICTGSVALFALIFLLIIIFDKTCRTVSMILLCNSFLSEIIFACVMLSMVIFTLQNDIKQISHQDPHCIFRGYMSYAISAVRSHSYLLQSIYRYIKVVYPSQRFFQSAHFQILLICLTWIISIIHPFPFLFTNQITYNNHNQVCHMALHLYPFIFYTCFLAYLNPITMIIIIYFKLVRYIQEMSKVVTPVNQLLRAQRELKMVRRIVLLVIVLITLGLPYTIFFFMSFFTYPPQYHFRIAFLFVDVSLVFVIIALFEFTDPIKIFSSPLTLHFSQHKFSIKPNSSHQNFTSKMTENTSAPVSSVQNVANANASPKKAAAKKPSKGKSTHGSSHPKYSDMIKSALKTLNDRGGSSRAAILKFVLANYSLDPVQANQHLKLALKNGVKAKTFKQTKGNGASGSFKLATNGDGPAKKKSAKPKKAASSSTAAAGTKKRARSKSAGAKPAKKVATAANTNAAAATIATATGGATATTAAKPKKAKATKSRSSATPKSAGVKKASKPKQAKAKATTAAKPAGAKKTATKKVAKPKVKKATTPKKPKSTATKKPAAAKKASKPKAAAKKAASPKKVAK